MTTLTRTCQTVVPGAVRYARGRRGLSLLEVLVSMFVLLFGLLGVAALFPLGQYNVSRASRYDRAAAVGQAAFNEIKVRGFLQPAQYSYLLLTAANPFRVQFDPLATTAPVLPVVTVPGLIRNATNPSDSAAWHVFVSRDDLKTDLPLSRDLPAVQMYNTSRSYDGHYSWMFTVSPSETSSDVLVVSVAVCHRRIPANDFAVSSFSTGGGFNGGQASFAVTNTQANAIKPGSWFMYSRVNAATAPVPPGYQPYFRWCQVESFRNDPPNGSVQFSGPNFDTVNAGNLPQQLTFYDGVIAVYEKLMRIDGAPEWSW